MPLPDDGYRDDPMLPIGWIINHFGPDTELSQS